MLGNPPCSPDKYTIGDEVIWELLIENMKEDLIIVTKDYTFHENLSLLTEEYQQRTGRTLLLVTEKFSEASPGEMSARLQSMITEFLHEAPAAPTEKKRETVKST